MEGSCLIADLNLGGNNDTGLMSANSECKVMAEGGGGQLSNSETKTRDWLILLPPPLIFPCSCLMSICQYFRT